MQIFIGLLLIFLHSRLEFLCPLGLFEERAVRSVYPRSPLMFDIIWLVLILGLLLIPLLYPQLHI